MECRIKKEKIMSTMLLSLNHFKTAYNKACSFYNHYTIDINYCYMLNITNEGRMKILFKDWYELNYRSFYFYDMIDEDELRNNLNEIDRWSYNSIKEKPCNTYQELKLLECIRYNIDDYKFSEEEIMRFKVSLDFLNNVIDSLKDTIIGQIDEYKNAKWCI